jgi:hypothetical protein
VAAGTKIRVSVDMRLLSRRGSLGRGLWLLKKADNKWTVIPFLSGAVRLETGYFIPLPGAGFRAGTFAAEPSNAVVSESVNDQVAAEFATAIHNYSNPLDVFLLGHGLCQLEATPAVTGIYRTLATYTDPEVRLMGLAGLLGSDGENSTWALKQIAKEMELIPRLHVRGVVIPSICSIRNSDRGAVESLGQISLSSDIALRRCAAMALDFIHTRDTLPFLAELLNSGDAGTREYAIQGLSRFVDNLPVQNPSNIRNGQALLPQGPAPYRTAETDQFSLSKGWLGSAEEAPYLQFWRSWWDRMKGELFPAVP